MPRRLRTCLLALALPGALAAQAGTDMQRILERLERLERENRALTEEVRALREEVAAARGGPDIEERVAVTERRTEELAQSKVGTANLSPLTVTGMALFNAFWNGPYGGDQQYPVVAQAARGQANAGGSLRQSVIGLRLDGPQVAGGGRISGALFTDLFAGSANSLNQLLRVRVATIGIEWENTSFIVGQDKPIVSAREPRSLAQVGYSPLTAAGNLWLWQPQVRIERRQRLGDGGFLAQGGVFETSEAAPASAMEYSGGAIARRRPAIQGRFEVWRRIGDSARVEIAPAFHASDTRFLGASVPSRLAAVDWMVQPVSWADFSGTLFRGQNVAVLGSLRQGFTVRNSVPQAVRAWGGWGQLSLRPTARLSFSAFTGQQDDRNADLLTGNIAKNLAFGANAMYRLGPNVVAAFEAARIRTTYLGAGARAFHHYDLALAYLF
jgi:hypothetical protein